MVLGQVSPIISIITWYHDKMRWYFIHPRTYRGRGGGVVATTPLRFFRVFSYTIKHQHLTFSVA